MKKLLILISLIALSSCKKQTRLCTVKSHNVTSDRQGNATYNTVISCSDGTISSKEGLRLYDMEVDAQFTDTFFVGCLCE
jgi:hypothetical protein